MLSWSLQGAMRRRGFSLIELLVVLLIFAILVAIAVPSLISSLPERNLAAAGDQFANDFNYCRAKAEATGNQIYMGFEFSADPLQVEGWWDDSVQPMAPAEYPTKRGVSFIPPANPGVSRTARAYYIVEARPRYKADGAPMTYLDWLIALDEWDNSDNDPPYPVEPLFPFSVPDTLAAGTLPDPTLGAFNAIAAPLVAYPQDMRGGSPSTVYDVRFRYLPDDLNGSGGWLDGDPDDQQFKLFCVADEATILAYDQNVDYVNNQRTYDPVPGGAAGGHSGSHGDHPKLLDQVVDYVLLKRVELPEYVYLVNPWKNSWVVGWEGPTNNRRFEVQDMQYLQNFFVFNPHGEIDLATWSYDPESFPDGSVANLNHGTIASRSGMPVVRSVWLTIEECLDFGGNSTYARANLSEARKVNQTSSGRMMSFWPLNGKYYVTDYTPNDGTRKLELDDPRLNLDFNDATNDVESDEMPLVAREYGYAQNFLVP